VNGVVEREDVNAILAVSFDLSIKLERIAEDVRVIRWLLEDGDEEEEEGEAPEPSE